MKPALIAIAALVVFCVGFWFVFQLANGSWGRPAYLILMAVALVAIVVNLFRKPRETVSYFLKQIFYPNQNL